MNRHVVTGALWLSLYLLLTLAPLALVLLVPGESRPGRGFWVEFSVALGFVGLAMMTLQFVLTARFEWLKAPFGSDVIYAFHRQISIVSIVLILAHPLILLFVRPDDMLRRLNPFTAPAPARFALLATFCLVALAVVSIFRKQLGIGYDWWRRMHGVLAIVAVGAGVAHILLIGHYLSTPLQRGLWLAYTGAFVALILYIRVVKPWLELRRPYEVVEVRPERAQAWTIALRPRGHAGMRFAPGQFAWITLGSSPFSDREHPFSFSGSAEARDGRLEFTIKERGDFTQGVKHVAPGATAYVDGPFGSLSADRHPDATGFALVAGGVGITPMMSHLRTFADRAGGTGGMGETRPLVLFYCSNAWDRVIFREEIDALAARLPTLKVVHVLAQGHEGWTGETGFLTAAILKRHLPADLSRWEAFICGPTPMMDAAERALHEIGMPLGNFHSEQFELV